MAAEPTALAAFLAEAPDSRLVLRPGDPAPEAGRRERVAVVVPDRAALRSLVVPPGVRSAAIAVWLDDATAALTLVARPEWPALVLLRARAVDGGWLTVLRFAAPAPVDAVVAELGRTSVWPDRTGHRGLVVGRPRSDKVPPDVLLGAAEAGSSEASGVTGRSPLVVTDPDGPLALGPLDERVLNPIGFDPAPTAPTATVERLVGPVEATEALVRRLRTAAGVALDLSDGRDDRPVALARGVAGLAMAGVPLVADAVPPSVAHLLGEPVAGLLGAAPDLADPVAREEHSVRLRRAALSSYSSLAWRRRLGELSGVRVAWQPAVSVVLATRRPELLEHALAQAARQRGVDSLELVLAPHGFDVDPARVAELVPGRPVAVVPQPARAVFGDVLQAAARRASGDVVVKMDDDDWYGPDLVADLLLARAYSGAELVGTGAEWYYLEPLDTTMRQPSPAEVYRGFVAGGTMLVERTLLHEAGGFRAVRKHVDAQLLWSVRVAGGTVFRTHGFGYVLRRGTGDHTSAEDLDVLRERAVLTRPGRSFSPLMEA
ncbi:glycosyltransferase [Nocardioides sp. SYSU D00038]|uniref:glycosyltransferase n=1 Tax=Nocardioides sp. SYSU D00038 TaxID=2812554 RepID=UPI0019680ACD|nr:glycosyltransferase [Nocardioides sp. SYSU D00038]